MNYISDLHLFHENSIKFDERPFDSLDEMHETIKKRWNSKITNGDRVFILGDISYRGKNEDLIAYISTLKGQKEVHDSANGKNYNLVLSHYPIFSWKRMGKGFILLYGHTHDSNEDAYYQSCLMKMVESDCQHVYKTEVRAINVGCMKPWMNYEPRTLTELLSYSQ